MKPYLLHITFSTENYADDFATLLLNNKLSPCCQKIPINSTFLWKGEIETGSEFLLIIKTFDTLVNKIKLLCDEKHPYDVYQLYGYEIQIYNDGYGKWMQLECRKE